MDEYLDAIAGAMRGQVEAGRSHGQLAVELELTRRLVSRIVCGERRVGAKTLVAIIRADPPWLCDVLAAGFEAQVGWVGHLLTGAVIGRGSNFLHQFVERFFPRGAGEGMG